MQQHKCSINHALRSKCSIADCGEKMISLRDAVDEAGIDVVFAETKVASNIDRIFLCMKD